MFERIFRAFAGHRPPAPRVVSMVRAPRDSTGIVETDGQRVEYRGEGTVWHRYPDGARAPSGLERLLCDAWTAAEWRR